jgi:hypothetical protein
LRLRADSAVNCSSSTLLSKWLSSSKSSIAISLVCYSISSSVSACFQSLRSNSIHQLNDPLKNITIGRKPRKLTTFAYCCFQRASMVNALISFSDS